MVEPRTRIKSIREYDPPLEGRREKIRLDFNENTAGCSPAVAERLRSLSPDEIMAYPEYEEFVQELATSNSIEPKNILLTNGVDEGIRLLTETYLGQGDQMLLPVPTYAMFEVYASKTEATIVKVPYNSNLTFPTDNVLKALNKKTKLVVIVNPNSPTGSVVDNDTIRAMLTAAPNALVVVDEAYGDFYGRSAIGLLQKYKNLVITRTFSKAYGLAGLRLGYTVASSKIIRELRKVASPYAVSTLAVIAGKTALRDRKYIDSYVETTKQGREYLMEMLSQLGIKTYPSEANFILASFGEKCTEICERLAQEGILIRNRTNSPLLEGCARITVGTKEQCQLLIDTLKRILRQELLLFDLDGVLVDVSNSYREAIKKTVKSFVGKEPSSQDIQRLKNKGGYNNDWDLSAALIREQEVEIAMDDVVAQFQYFYLGDSWNGFIQNESWLLDTKILQELYEKYRLGIVTGRPKEEALYTLSRFNVAQYFDTIVALEDVAEGKPDPSGLLLAQKNTGGTNARYIGDSVDDMQAATRAKISAIGVLPAGVEADSGTLRSAGAQVILQDVNNIQEVLS